MQSYTKSVIILIYYHSDSLHVARNSIWTAYCHWLQEEKWAMVSAATVLQWWARAGDSDFSKDWCWFLYSEPASRLSGDHWRRISYLESGIDWRFSCSRSGTDWRFSYLESGTDWHELYQPYSAVL